MITPETSVEGLRRDFEQVMESEHRTPPDCVATMVVHCPGYRRLLADGLDYHRLLRCLDAMGLAYADDLSRSSKETVIRSINRDIATALRRPELPMHLRPRPAYMLEPPAPRKTPTE